MFIGRNKRVLTNPLFSFILGLLGHKPEQGISVFRLRKGSIKMSSPKF